jgi:hypothetical protein
MQSPEKMVIESIIQLLKSIASPISCQVRHSDGTIETDDDRHADLWHRVRRLIPLVNR